MGPAEFYPMSQPIHSLRAPKFQTNDTSKFRYRETQFRWIKQLNGIGSIRKEDERSSCHRRTLKFRNLRHPRTRPTARNRSIKHILPWRNDGRSTETSNRRKDHFCCIKEPPNRNGSARIIFASWNRLMHQAWQWITCVIWKSIQLIRFPIFYWNWKTSRGNQPPVHSTNDPKHQCI